MGKKSTQNRHDWASLKKEFLTGNYKNLAEFKRKHGFTLTLAKPFTGWIEEKKAMSKQVIEAAKAEVVKAEAESIAQVRQRQANMARYLQVKGAEKLKTMPITTAEDARKLIVSGLQEERKALGMEGGGAKNLTQINVNPKTNIDKLLEGLDYVGTLELIAELKRERTRRTLPDVDDSGSEEITDGETV